MIDGLIMDHGASVNDYPRSFDVQVSEDGTSWTKLGTYEGSANRTAIQFGTRRVKSIKVTNLSDFGLFWSVHELDLLGEAE